MPTSSDSSSNVSKELNSEPINVSNRLKFSCDQCRKAHRKCDGRNPCSSCIQRSRGAFCKFTNESFKNSAYKSIIQQRKSQTMQKKLERRHRSTSPPVHADATGVNKKHYDIQKHSRNKSYSFTTRYPSPNEKICESPSKHLLPMPTGMRHKTVSSDFYGPQTPQSISPPTEQYKLPPLKLGPSSIMSLNSILH